MLIGDAHVPLVTLEINVTHIVNVIQMGLLTKTVMLMGDAPVQMDIKEPNAMNVKLDLPKILRVHV